MERFLKRQLAIKASLLSMFSKKKPSQTLSDFAKQDKTCACRFRIAKMWRACVWSPASLEILGGYAEACMRLNLRSASAWDLHACLQYPVANSNLQEHMVQRGKVDKRREREQGLRTEYVRCHHIHRLRDADRMNVMPVGQK